MSNLLTATVTIRGVRPMLWHAFGPDALPLERQAKTGVAGNSPDEWKKTVRYTSDWQLCVDGAYAFAMIVAGAKNTKRKRGSIQPFVQSTLQVLDERLLIDRFLPNGIESLETDPTLPVYLDVRGVVNPSTKGRNIRYRVAASTGWMTTFHILWDQTIVSKGEMEASIRDGGQFNGLGNGRSIGYGRFEVVEFKSSAPD